MLMTSCFSAVATLYSFVVLTVYGERDGSVVERWLSGNLPPPCCVLEQDTLLPESTGNTQEAVAPSRHD